ncbi:MAG: glycosyltransferase [Bacteroidetes bacterium]|nr:glycosyltransferase [Bacteroidota bacterium]
MAEKKKILVAPLDWGLGHATRCIPIIQELLNQGEAVILAGEKNTESLLKKEFPMLEFIPLRGYRPSYSTVFPMWVMMMIQAPKFFFRIFLEHHELKKIIRRHQIDAVISDNRFGLWNPDIFSVFITHQVMIKCPPALRLMEPFLYFINSLFIKQYDECWIPDDDKNLSGDLSHRHKLPSNAVYIGTLSRWKGKINHQREKKYEVIGIVSGPEPHRSSLEKLFTEQFRNSKALIVGGKPGEKKETAIHENTTVVSHLDSRELLEAVLASNLVVCRAGYSGIMDMVAIGMDAVLVPTPGQTEQLYLADYLCKRKFFFSVRQEKFDFGQLKSKTQSHSVTNFPVSQDSLPGIISAWRKKINGW